MKFTAPVGRSGEFALAVALRYLRALDLQGKPDAGAVWCFDGKNQAGPARADSGRRVRLASLVGRPCG